MPGRWSALAAGFELIINCQHEVSTNPGKLHFPPKVAPAKSSETVFPSTGVNSDPLSMNRTHPRAPPRRGAGVHPRISVPLLGGVRGGFMVPMHGRKAEGALHKH